MQKVKGVVSKTYDEVGLAMEDLYAGRLDGVVCDDPVAADYALNQKKYKETLKIAGKIETGDVEFYGIAVNKGNKEILALINKGIKLVQGKGIDKATSSKMDRGLIVSGPGWATLPGLFFRITAFAGRGVE